MPYSKNNKNGESILVPYSKKKQKLGNRNPMPVTIKMPIPLFPGAVFKPCSTGPPHKEEPILEPSNVIVQPAVVPPPNRHGRLTNQLQYIQEHVINEVWNEGFAEHFRHPVNAKNLPVS